MKRIVLAIAALVACADDSGPQLTEGMPPPPPDTTSSTTLPATSTDTTGSVAGCCAADVPNCEPSACPDGYCVAERDLSQSAPPPAESFTCRPECVPTNLVGLWCTTNATCCDADATCDQNSGLCKVPFEGTTTTDTDGSTTAAESSSSTSSGSSSSSSSSTSSASTGTESDTADADTTAG